MAETKQSGRGPGRAKLTTHRPVQARESAANAYGDEKIWPIVASCAPLVLDDDVDAGAQSITFRVPSGLAQTMDKHLRKLGRVKMSEWLREAILRQLEAEQKALGLLNE